MFCFKSNFIEYKMNAIINNFLLSGDKVLPEMHLRQPQFTYSATVDHLVKTKKEQKNKKNKRYKIYLQK